jgi:5,10-methylenetetrahydromethanopterin reductase
VFVSSVNLMPEGSVTELVTLAVEAEQLGYDRVWVYDEGLVMRDCYVNLTAVALATNRVQLGTGITNPYTRHPATTAAAIATLQELSGGRAFLGLGAGGSLTLGPLNTDRRKPLTATRDTLLACRRLFDGETVTMQGHHFELTNARLAFGGHPTEIWLAGRGPNMLQMGGELASGVMLDFLHEDFFGDAVSLVRSGQTKTRNTPVKICYSTMVVTTDQEMDAARPHITYRVVDSQPKIKERLGIRVEDVENIRAALAHGIDEAAQYIKTDWVRPFVISGSPEECSKQLRTLMTDHALDEFQIPVLEMHNASGQMQAVARIVDNARGA